MELTELMKLNKKLMEVVNQANSMNEELNQSKQVVRLLVSDLDDAKDRLLQIIGEATVNDKLDKWFKSCYYKIKQGFAW